MTNHMENSLQTSHLSPSPNPFLLFHNNFSLSSLCYSVSPHTVVSLLRSSSSSLVCSILSEMLAPSYHWKMESGRAFLPCPLSGPSFTPKVSSALSAFPYSTVHPIPPSWVAERCDNCLCALLLPGWAPNPSLTLPTLLVVTPDSFVLMPPSSQLLLFLFFLKPCSGSSTAATGLGPFFLLPIQASLLILSSTQ